MSLENSFLPVEKRILKFILAKESLKDSRLYQSRTIEAFEPISTFIKAKRK